MSKWDKWLEANGLLKYQTKDLTAAEVQQRYASVGLNVDWKSLGRPEPAQQSSQQNYAGWTAPNQPAPATATALPSQAPTVTAFSGGLQSPPPNPQDLGEAGRGSGVRIPTFEVGTGKYLGALPTSYWENPQTVVRWYNTAQANPNAALPQGMDKDTLAGIYNYMKMRNGTVPSSQWKYLSPDDPLKQYVASLPAPSDNFLLPAEKAAWGTKQNLSAQNAIVDFRASQFDWTKLSADQKHAILNNPNFHISQVIALGQQGLILGDPLFDWSKTKPFLGVIPQKWVFNALANPTTAPAAQAVFMTALTKNVPMGFGALALGYGSQIKDWGQQNNFLPGEKLGNVLEKTGQALMWGAQTVEQLQGLYMQLSGQNPKKLSILDNQPTFTPNHWADLQQEVQKAGGWDKWLEAAWEAGKNYYTTRPGAYEAVDATLSGLHELGIAKDKQAQNAVYVLGEDQPVQVRPGYTLENARQRILNGEDPGVVQADFQREYGVSGMITQLALQTIYDPLQLAHEVESAGVEKFGKLTGNAELAEAARVGKPGLMGALETYKNDYLRSGVKPLPDFSWFDHALSGINEKGEATYLRPSKAPLIQEGPFAGLHNLRGGGLSGIKDFFFSLTNNSRAGLAGEALTNHINLLVDKAGYDPEVFGELFKSVAGTDMEKTAEGGARYLGNPEIYQVLPFLREFASDKLPKLLEEGRLADSMRPIIEETAGALKIEPEQLLERLQKTIDPEAEFQKIVGEASGSPEGARFLDKVDRGEITSERLNTASKIFDDVPYSREEWFAKMNDSLAKGAADWMQKYYGLVPDGPVKSFFGIMKKVQSLALLGILSPLYPLKALHQALVTRLAGGAFGFKFPWTDANILERFGVEPARTNAGAGALGSEFFNDYSNVQKYLHDLTRPDNTRLGALDAWLGKAGQSHSIMGILSAAMEKMQSRSAMADGIIKMWSRLWRRGVGISDMPAHLIEELRAVDKNLPDTLYSIMEDKLNGREVDAGFYDEVIHNRHINEMINRAARGRGMESAEAVEMLHESGILDSLKTRLEEAGRDPSKVSQVYRDVQAHIDEWMDTNLKASLTTWADHMTAKAQTEGFAGAWTEWTDMLRARLQRGDSNLRAWDDLFDHLQEIKDPGLRRDLIESTRDLQNRAVARRAALEGATLTGFKNYFGFDDPQMREFEAALFADHELWNDTFAQIEKTYGDFFNRDTRLDFTKRVEEWNAARAQAEKLFSDAFEASTRRQQGMGQVLANLHEERFGPASGAQAEKFYKSIGEMQRSMRDTLREIRSQINDHAANGESRAAAHQGLYESQYVPLLQEYFKRMQSGIPEALMKAGEATPPKYEVFGGSAPTEGSGRGGSGRGSARSSVLTQVREAWPKFDAHNQAEAMNSLVNKALRDPLTGLETIISKSAEEGKPAGWVVASSHLNALKAINDTWGHHAGDIVISTMGRVIRQQVEAVGGRAFRMGGDEVSYWFPSEAAANQALKAIDERFLDAIITFEVNGQSEERQGFSLSYGIGSDEGLAKKALYADKENRLGLGQRAERGQIPRSIHRIDGKEGTQNETGVHGNPAEGEVNRGELSYGIGSDEEISDTKRRGLDQGDERNQVVEGIRRVGGVTEGEGAQSGTDIHQSSAQEEASQRRELIANAAALIEAAQKAIYGGQTPTGEVGQSAALTHANLSDFMPAPNGRWREVPAGSNVPEGVETRVFADGTLRGRIKIPELSPELRKAISSKPDNMPALEQLRALWPTLDQSDRTQAAYWLMHKMQFDPVSGLETIFSMQMETGKPEGWVSGISDLNGLGAINDHWGQDAGNRVVSRMGDVINEEVARVGSRAFRTGGDEVTYWFPSEEVANQALRAIDTRFQNATINVEYEGQLVPQKGFSLSYGTGSEEKIADEALYEDKEFRSRLGQRAERGQIPRSIHRDNGEEGLSHGVQVDRISNLGRDRTAEVNREELIAKAAELETAIQEQSAAAQKAIYGDQAPAAGSPNESLKQNLANRLGPSLGKETGKSIDALGEKARGWAREHGFDENATAAYLMERMRGAKDPAKLLKQVLSTEGMPADMRSAMQHLREYQDALHKPRPEWSPIEKALTLDRPVSDEELSQYPFLQAAFDKKTESYPMTNGLEIKKLANLTPAQRIVEARFVEAINNNLPDIIEKYWQSRGEGERNVLAVDLIRELSPDYALNEKSRMAYTQAVRAPALALFDKMYELKLAEPLTGDFARDFVATKAGAPGSGKNGAIGNVKELAAKFKDAHLVLDVTLSDPSALHLLDDALKSGRRLLSVFVARDPIKALMEGIVPRAQEGEGRSILLEQWARAHAGAPETFRRALIKYAGNPDVELRVVDNTRGLQEPHDVPIHLIHDFLKDRIYNEKVLRQRGIEELEKGVQDGRIRPDVYQAITGYDFGGEGGLYEQLAARRAKVVGARSLPRVGEPGYGRTDQPDEIERPGGSTEGARSVGGGGTQETSGVSGWGNREVQEAATEGNRRGSEKAAGQQGLKPETAGKLPPEVKALLPIGRGPVVEQLRKAWPKMDASMQAEVMNWLVNKVLYDPISGLETTFSKIAEEGKPAGWVDAISDLNALKAINDHMGHGAGNLVISRMGQIIREKVQAVSGRAFRVGGDEVSYWFPNEEAANQALRAIDEEFQNDIIKFELDDGQRVRMKGFTLSYGIGSDEKLADKALYADKEIRRGLGQRDERGQLPRSIHRVDGEEGAQNKNSVHRNTEEANRGELTAEAANGGTSASAPYRDKSLYTPGVYDKIAGHLPEAEILSEVWADQMAPLLEAMRFETLKGDLREFKFTDLPPETQAALREWVNKVKHEDMPTAKLQTIKFAEWLRDETLLNYNRRTPFGELIDVPAPYRYWATESMLKHGLRAIDSPAWFATLARLSAFSNAYQRQMPERLRGKVRIRIPFAPSWMRSSLFVDPRRATFPYTNLLAPIQAMTKDVQPKGNDSSQAFDFMKLMAGPALTASIPYLLNVRAGAQNASALQAALADTPLKPMGDMLNHLTAGPVVNAAYTVETLSRFAKWDDYYAAAQIAKMAAQGLVSLNDAKKAIASRQTPLRLPPNAEHLGGVPRPKGVGEGGLLPSGELKFRGDQAQYDSAMKAFKEGNQKPLTAFFADHPDYASRVYASLRGTPEEKLRSFLVGAIWDSFAAAPNQKQATAFLGSDFKRAFLDDATRSYESVPTDQLVTFARILGQDPLRHSVTPPPNTKYLGEDGRGSSTITAEFLKQRADKFPNAVNQETAYNNLPPSERARYILKHPEYADYLTWRADWASALPKGQPSPRADLSHWPPMLLHYAGQSALTGAKLPGGVNALLKQIWAAQGKPAGDFKVWLEGSVYPSIKQM